jgi:streptomycin 3"-adenylyltransferase
MSLEKGVSIIKYVSNEFVNRSKEILEDNLVGIYLHGSAVMGCFNPDKSDIDLIVVINDKMDNATKRAFMNMVVDQNKETPAKGIEMSIVTRDVCNPFVYPTPFELHFSAMHLGWYGDNPDDYIRKMNGTDKDLAAHFTIIRKRGECLFGQAIEEVFGEVPEQDYMDSIWEDIVDAPEDIAGNTMYLTLNLARVLAYCKDKLILSKKEGGEWGLDNLPEKYHSLISTALREYTEGTDLTYDIELAKDYAKYMVEKISSNQLLPKF